MSEDLRELEFRILERAYFLWVENGRPEGRAEEFWFRACEMEAAGGRRLDAEAVGQLMGEGPSARRYVNGE